MKKPNRKRIFIGAFVVAIVLLVALLMQPKGIRVETAAVTVSELRVLVQEQGRTRVRQRYTIASPISGRLIRTLLEVGDRVQAGQVLARIAPPPEDPRVQATLRAGLAAAVAREAEAKALLKESESTYGRARREASRRAELHDKGLVSVETRDLYVQTASAARAHLASAKAALAAANAEVLSAQSRLLGVGDIVGGDSFTTVRAPVTGLVLRIDEESERVVAAGAPLMEIGQEGSLELVIDVLTQDAVKVKAGNEMVITGWGGDTDLRARVRYVEASAFTKFSSLGVEEQRINVIGDLLATPKALGAGYRVDAAIVVWQANDVLVVPNSAIFRRQGAWHVFAVEQKIARLRAIEIGQRGVAHTQVLSGLAADDRVIVFPSDLVNDGVKLELAND